MAGLGSQREFCRKNLGLASDEIPYPHGKEETPTETDYKKEIASPKPLRLNVDLDVKPIQLHSDFDAVVKVYCAQLRYSQKSLYRHCTAVQHLIRVDNP